MYFLKKKLVNFTIFAIISLLQLNYSKPFALPGKVLEETDIVSSNIKNKNKIQYDTNINNEISFLKNESSKNTTSSHHSIHHIPFFESFNAYIKAFIDNPNITFSTASNNVLKPFADLYNRLSIPDYDKVETGVYYSEIIHLKIIPLVKTTGFIASILLCFIFIFYLSYNIAKFTVRIFCCKFHKDFKRENHKYDNRISLKGRIKRSPNNINYNELFLEKETKIKKKKKELNQNSNNLDEFFLRIKEKEEFDQVFSNRNETHIVSPQIKNENTNNIYQIDENENLLVFDTLDANITKDNKNYNEIKKEKQSFIVTIDKTKNQTDVISQIQEENNENEKSLSMEDKMKNSSYLFHQTPLANIRKNTISKKQ